MGHCISPDAEAILDKAFTVLDKGFVRLVDYLGNDERVVQAARVSYGAGTKTYREDAALIDYLLRNRHTSPFEQVVLTFHLKMPIFVARQWVRHRTARLNEVSARYSTLKDDCYIPDPIDIAPQSPSNRQGRADTVFPPDTAENIRNAMDIAQQHAYADYQELLEKGLARELARINLPLAIYTEMYWQIDLNNLFHFLMLRLSPHAQSEIRAYASILLDIANTVAPRCCASFKRHILNAITFSDEEVAELKRRLQGSNGEPLLSGRALELFEEKLEK
jgi:thymidylate synthase (FAD)